jgi:hypothetical protein
MKQLLKNHTINSVARICFVTIIIVVVLNSCSSNPDYKYPQDKNVSSINGTPKSSKSNYFQYNWFLKYFCNRNPKLKEIDSLSVESLSKELFLIREPILFNYYQENPTIRLIWDRSFAPLVVLRFEKRNNGIYLIEKSHPIRTKDFRFEKKISSYLIVYKTNVSERILTNFNWEQFQNKLTDSQFFNMSTSAFNCGLDGSTWTLEIQNPNSYKVVSRWHPDAKDFPEFRKLCDYLIDQSSFAKAERY